MKKFLLLLLIIIINLNAQSSIEIIETKIDEFPLIKSKLFIFDGNNPKLDISQDEILINDKGLISEINSFECSDGNLKDSLRIALVFDNSLNNDSVNNFRNFDVGHKLLKKLIETIDFSYSKAFLTSFDDINYLHSDISDSRDSLLKIADEIKYNKGSKLIHGLDYEPVGSLNLTEYYPDINTVIFITDGNQIAGLDSTANKFQDKGIKFFPLIINKNIPAKLSVFADETGGYYYQRIKNKTDLSIITKTILSFAKGYEPCDISWFSEVSCNDSSLIRVTVPSISAAKNFYYVFEADAKPTLESDPIDMGFSKVIPGNSKSLSITITARNSDIYISDMFLLDDRFRIEEGYKNDFILEENKFINLTISYTPTNTDSRADSAIVFTKLVFESDACKGNEVYVTGGFPNTPPVTKTIEVTNPKCGETLLVGDTILVEWIGLLRKDVVQIEYSLNNGVTWDSLVYNTDSLSYQWIVPDSVSDECLIRVIQMWPNNVGETQNLYHNDIVNSAFFNIEGDLAITASRDSTAVIWNSNTGTRVHVLSNHDNEVNYAVFGPNNKYAATASNDSTAKLWDIKTGEEILTFNIHKSEVNTVNFSNDGSMVVTACDDGTVIIYDTETGSIINEIDAFSEDLRIAWYAEFAPDDKSIITAGNSGLALEIDISSSEILKTFDARNEAGKGNATHVIFNHDGSKVSLVSEYNPKRLYVWEIHNGKELYSVNDTLYTLSHNADSTTNYVINSSSFYYDGIREYILTAGSDKVAKKWDANTGSPSDPHVFKEHEDIVETAVFNFDARRVITSSWDYTAKIWNLDRRDLQIDTTDCAFAIAYANADSNDIAFGKVPLNEVKDTLVFPIKNLSGFDYNVSSMRIIDDVYNEFQIVNEKSFPFILDSLDSQMIELRYEPNHLGLSSCKIEFKIPGSTIISNVSAESVIKDIEEHTKLVDFGVVQAGEIKDTSFSFFLTNKSINPQTIDSIWISGLSEKEFTYSLDSELPVTLNPNEELPFDIRFAPRKIGLKNAQMNIFHSGRFSVSKINLFGISDVLVKDTVFLSVGSAFGVPGDLIEIPIKMSVAKNRDLKETIQGFSAELSFNSTLLEPVGNFKSDRIINEYTREISFDMDNLQDSIIKLIQFKVGLGNDTLSHLDLKYTYPLGEGTVAIIENDGMFYLSGYCNGEEPRLFDPYGRLSLDQNIPNPAINSTTIKFEILEPGYTELFVTDMLGKLNKVLLNEYMLPGKYEIIFDTNSLPSGVYNYILQTPVSKISRRMEIRK